MSRKRALREVGGVQEAQCTTCKQWFDFTNFYKSKRGSLGIKSECKKCHCLTNMATRDLAKHRATNREWMRSSGYQQRPEVRARDLERSRVKNCTIHAKARALANRAVELGFLTRPELCPQCGRDGKIHAHHEDYTKPLDVEWLCTVCHGERHQTL